MGDARGDARGDATVDEAVLRKVLAEALRSGGDLAEVYLEDKSSTALKLEDSRIEDVVSGHDAGAGIRILSGERASYAYTNVIDETALLEAARAARAGLSGAGNVTVGDLREVQATARHPVRISPESVGAGDKAAALRVADEAARAAGADIRQVVSSYMDVRQRITIASSEGSIARDDRTRTRFAVQAVAARDGRIATGFEAPGHSGGFELLEERPAAALGSKAAAKALRQLDAKPSPAGEFPVVLAPGAGGVLIHEACGHGLEGDTIAKNASVYAGREGERFGSDSVTIVDDGSVEGEWGSFGVDDEGTPSQRTILFEKGILVGNMNDIRSAAKLEGRRTGNGRRQSYAHLPIVRMTNTYLLPGPDDADEIIRSVERGVYVASFAGGEVNPATGNFVFGMNEAFMIENGEITDGLRGANLIGNGPKVLSVIDAVAADFDVWWGVCGKDGQHAPVTNGMPTVLLGRMTVGGTEA
jgi:TldD protein